MAKYSESQKRAVTKYNAKAYDSFLVRVPKGDKAKYQAIAEARGVSLNALINELLKSLEEA